MRPRLTTSAVLVLALSLHPIAASADAQSVPPRDSAAQDSSIRDTLPADTVVRRPIHPAWAYLIAPGMIVLPVVAAFAPARSGIRGASVPAD